MNEYRQQQLRAPNLYRYHGIAYTYADLITAHQKQQQTAWKHIERGDYESAHNITSTDPREFLPQIYGTKEPIETGDKRTLTPRRKCGIIKAIRRHVNRWKQKREGKTMKYYEFGFYADSGEFFEIRENGFDDGRKYYVTADNAEKAYSEFVGVLDEEYCGEEMTVREIPTGHDMTNYIKL